ncbi:MAG: pantoate--beta-alanine ligase [Chitinophagales bacterium]|nr:pantoate--beta-alanine ligase [Chitinophagales bacterium]MCO5279545.1 pantoate--beta-alanine ligase [Chitinophagales bacterium]OJV24231.1 MAG: pantoate--beta-alanine ligase [Bacteroidetes bacterium 37-13]HRN94722.1 pantoate--beta-alanine ligase [Chitinophagales bacterium]HRP39995.1 pantoate--beta-alanine ligase [Chitinophagales bacterium]
MKIFKTVADWKNELATIKGKTLYFVPTMGALHQGHLSLVEKAKRKNTYVVVSIFVNPTQFNNAEDFAKYPITTEKDIALLEQVKCDAVFLPSVKEMYPNGTALQDEIDFGFMAQTLEGEFRPGHFAGMAQVVERLLRIIEPQKLFMGLKDFQQAIIVGELIKKRKLKIELVKCPTKREADGLAMSSRNVRLDKKSRAIAVQLSKALFYTRRKIQRLKREKNLAAVKTIVTAAKEKLAAYKEIEIEYFEVRNAETLRAETKISDKSLVALVAANIGGVRLIDNVVIA